MALSKDRHPIAGILAAGVLLGVMLVTSHAHAQFGFSDASRLNSDPGVSLRPAHYGPRVASGNDGVRGLSSKELQLDSKQFFRGEREYHPDQRRHSEPSGPRDRWSPQVL